MKGLFLGMSVITALLAVIPSKTEQEKPVPYASIVLAILSGISAMMVVLV